LLLRTAQAVLTSLLDEQMPRTAPRLPRRSLTT
jgi:hypothetical protein